MQYELTGNPQLIRVIYDHPAPHNESVYDRFFSGREVMLNDQGRWVWVECTPKEWSVYLGELHRLFVDDGMLPQAAFFETEMRLFMEWMNESVSLILASAGPVT